MPGGEVVAVAPLRKAALTVHLAVSVDRIGAVAGRAKRRGSVEVVMGDTADGEPGGFVARATRAGAGGAGVCGFISCVIGP